MKTIIGLAGVKESGKTTTFNLIQEAFPGVVEVTLAKKLKDVCSSVLGISRNAFDDQTLKERELRKPVCLTQENVTALIEAFGYTPDFDKHVRPHIGTVLDTARRVAQYVGTEVLRNVDTDIHCVGATRDLPEEGLFVVTDMSFPSEFNFFQTRFPTFFAVGIRNYAAEAKVGPNSHASEHGRLELAKSGIQVENNSTIQDLKARVVPLVNGLLDQANRVSRAG